MVSLTEVAQADGPLRILYVITKANWGGAQRYVYDLAVAALAAGNEVMVVAGAQGELTDRLVSAGITVACVERMQRNIRLADEISALRSLLRIVRDFKPNIIHGNSSKAGGLAAVIGRLTSVKMILFTVHGWAFNEERPELQKAIITLAHYATVLLSSRVVCVSESLARDIAWMPFVRDRIRVIQNGIEPAELLPQEEARRRLAADLARATWIGTIAELHPTKQLPVLIEAFARLSEAHPETALVIIGDGEERERLQSIIEEHGLSARVRLCGHRENAAAYLPALDIFALPSRSEGLGYVLLEAGLARLPVVASRVGGIPEIVRDKESGILVPAGDAGVLAGTLELLLSNARLREQLGHALYERVIRVFPKNRMIRETLALYQER